MRSLLALAAALGLTLLATAAQSVEMRTLRIEHDGRERRAILDARSDLRAAPVLIVLHGGIAGPEWMRRRARVSLARQGWAVLYPFAIDDWNDGRLDRRGRPYDDADDVGFLRALVARLVEAGVADSRRVFFAGPSLGGTMVLRMLCEAPDLVAGAAVAISSFADGKDCADGPPRPILYVHGTEDGIMPPEGGRIGGDSIFVRDRGRVRPVDETLQRLAFRNRCEGYRARPLPDRISTDGSTVELREYQGCAAPLVHYVVKGGGHTWPGSGEFRMGASLVGRTNQDFSATAAVERFFKALSARDGG
ncbi:MAG: hypothetical protein AAGI51_07175 [Pseudomonadota bacterium]